MFVIYFYFSLQHASLSDSIFSTFDLCIGCSSHSLVDFKSMFIFFARWQIYPSMSAEEKLYQSCIFSDQRWSQNFVCFLWICFPGLWVNPILVKIAPEQKIGPGLLGELYHLVMDFSWKFCGIKPQDPRVNRFSQSPG